MEPMTEETKRGIVEDFFCTMNEQGILIWLDENGFYSAPASKGHHGAKPGALFDHSLQMTYELQHLTEALKLKWERPESPYIVGMLHDVCKMDDYKIREEYETEDVSTLEEPGKTIKVVTNTVVDWNKEREYPGHGSKSIIMLMGHITLTEEEKMCNMYHMGAFTDSKEWEFYSRAVKKYPNVLYTQTADMIASQIKGV